MAPHMRGTTAVLGALFLALLLVPLGLTLWLDARWFAAQDLWPIFALRLQTQLGLGAAMAFILTLLILAFTLVQFRILGRRVFYG